MMKNISLILMTVFVMTVSVFGQPASGLTVVKYEMKPDETPRLSPNQNDSLLASADTSLPTNDRNTTIAPASNRRGTPAITADSPVTDAPEGSSIGGQRILKIVVELKNTTAKRIVGYELDCVLFEKDNKEYFRYRLVTDKPIKPGEVGKAKKTLMASNLPKDAPTAKIFGIVPADTKVEVVAVRFDDGTVWTIPK